ncbi:MAG: hypothetical protein ABI781_05875 [Burkholderiales bacterium]
MTSSLVRRLASLTALSTLCLSALAQTGGPSPAEITPPQAKKAPEQAAIDACKDKKQGDRVRFTDAKGKKRHYACAMVGDVLAARSGIATAAIKPKAK